MLWVIYLFSLKCLYKSSLQNILTGIIGLNSRFALCKCHTRFRYTCDTPIQNKITSLMFISTLVIYLLWFIMVHLIQSTRVKNRRNKQTHKMICYYRTSTVSAVCRSFYFFMGSQTRKQKGTTTVNMYGMPDIYRSLFNYSIFP